MLRMILTEKKSLQLRVPRQPQRRQRLLPRQLWKVPKNPDHSRGSGRSVDLVETVPPQLLCPVEVCSLLED